MKTRTIPIAMMALLLVSIMGGAQNQPANAVPVNAALPPDKASSAPANDPTVQAATQALATANNLQFSQRNPRYHLCPGDVVDIGFEFSPEFNQNAVAIQPDGFITLMGVGDIHVAGLTVPELTQTLKQAYGRTLADPVVTVVLKDFNRPYFIASGQVAKPGKYDLRADTTVTEAIAIAGGFQNTSKHSQVLLFRRVSGDTVEARQIDVKQMLAKRNLNEDLHLQPGDMIFVPQNKISKIRQFFNVPTMTMNPQQF